MNRHNKKAPDTGEQLDALGKFLTQLKTHRTESAGKKGTYGDYVRLLEYYRETRG